MRKEETIRLIDLETGYSNKNSVVVITRKINAALYSGELTCLLGPNGAGKSTLLKTLTAFLPPVAGKIFIKGKSLSDYSARDIAKLIGIVLTEKPHLENMTVEELIALGRSPYTGFWGRMDADDLCIVDEAIGMVGVEDLKMRRINTLSDGERQKVMIAKAIAQETPIVFLDEPTAFLDYPSKVEIMQLLQRLAKERGMTVFLSTHDMDMALQIADCVWLVDKKYGVSVGSPEDLAISGDLARYFKCDGIEFDKVTGLFQICHKLTKSVKMSGEGIYYDMALKALARQGVSTSRNGDSTINIEAEADGYVVNGKKFDSVSGLVDEVESLLNVN